MGRRAGTLLLRAAGMKPLVGLRGRREAVAIVVVLLGPQLLQAVGPDMMVGEHEAVGRHK